MFNDTRLSGEITSWIVVSQEIKLDPPEEQANRTSSLAVYSLAGS